MLKGRGLRRGWGHKGHAHFVLPGVHFGGKKGDFGTLKEKEGLSLATPTSPWLRFWGKTEGFGEFKGIWGCGQGRGGVSHTPPTARLCFG